MVLAGRERKKAKASDLEKTVAALADQLGNMEGVKAENATLQDKNLALVSQLRAREEELERLLREQACAFSFGTMLVSCCRFWILWLMACGCVTSPEGRFLLINHVCPQCRAEWRQSKQSRSLVELLVAPQVVASNLPQVVASNLPDSARTVLSVESDPKPFTSQAVLRA